MAITLLTGTLIKSGSIPTTALSGGVVSSSIQITQALPAGTVSSSTQVTANLPGGAVSSSTQFRTITDPFTGSFTGSFAGTHTGTFPYASLTDTPSGIVSSSAQVKVLLPADTVSSSAQVKNFLPDGTVSSSGQVSYTGLSNIPSEIVSSSTQVKAFLPNGTVSASAQYPGWVTSSTQIVEALPVGTVSSSAQVDITATTNYSTFSSSIATKNDTQDISINALNAATSSYAINSTIQSQLAGVASSSAQVKVLLPSDTVSSSAQVKNFLPDGTVSSSGQVSYTGLSNIPSGIVSSSTQVKNLLPDGSISSSTQVNAILDADGVISSSAQVQLESISGTTFSSNNFTFPLNLTVAGTLTAQQFVTELISSSIIYESGSTKFGDSTDDVMSVTGSIRVLGGSISGSMTGMFSSSAQVSYTGLSNIPSGIVSSSGQVTALLPTGTVSSSAQVSYTGLSNIPSGILSSSTQVNAILDTDGVISSSGQVNGANITNNSVSYTAGSGLTGAGAATLGGSAVTINIGAGLGVTVNADDVAVNTGSTHFINGARATISSTDTAGASGINLRYNNVTGIISASLVNSTISGVSLGNNLADLTAGTGITYNAGTTYNGGTARTINIGQAVATNSNVQFNSIGVGTAPSGGAGDIRATGEVTAFYTSDARLKENVTTIENALDILMNIRGVEFDWTQEHIQAHGGEDGYFVRKHDVGVIAQEVEAVFPDVVATKENGFKAVRYEKLVPLLIQAIRELKAELDELKKNDNGSK